MLDQLIIAGKKSFDDYEANVTSHKIVDGKKKTIKESVPFSNITHDFSKINGELYWEDKSLQYELEITANSVEELSAKISKFKTWAMNIMSAELHDPYIPDYHFIATFESLSVNDDEIEKATISLTYTAYPYMISNTAKTYECDLTSGEEQVVVVTNNSSHRITPTINASVDFSLKVGNEEYMVPSGEVTDNYLKLEVGETALALKSAESGRVSITFYEEVF